MQKKSKYIVSLKSFDVENQDFKFALDDEFLSSMDSNLLKKGNIKVDLNVKTGIERFEFSFHMNGVLRIPCDRCLDNVDFPVQFNELRYIKFGETFQDEGNQVIVIPKQENSIDISWMMYEMLVLQIPVFITHPEGECNKEMINQLNSYKVENQLEEDEASTEDFIDPRWEKLKKI